MLSIFVKFALFDWNFVADEVLSRDWLLHFQHVCVRGRRNEGSTITTLQLERLIAKSFSLIRVQDQQDIRRYYSQFEIFPISRKKNTRLRTVDELLPSVALVWSLNLRVVAK